ncbi:biotin synthase BioB [Micrococcoides hystricis]|uniref:Biotin synthase n=1 Tax=Micrococcoides hystricis TaxID=1572761 RepID=A0ABV6PBE5_9MICC
MSAPSTLSFNALAEDVLAGSSVTADQVLAILQAPDEQLMDLVAAGARLRREHFGNRVKLNYLVSLKSGLCPENCNYCSQALGSTAPILKYSWLSPEKALEQASHGINGGAKRVCFVASGRGPANRDIDRVGEIVSTLRDEHPDVEVCACLGLLKDGQAERLQEAGVDAYNHNINTAESHHEKIVQTHTYEDRTDTIEKAKGANLSPCSGLIVGMGESDEQLVEALFALRDLDSDSIPINFLIPFDGTPLAGTWELTPTKSLKIVAAARFVCPDKEIRLAGGREMHLRSLQATALHLANSIFLGDYLTSEGQAANDDLAMIRDNGFVIEGSEEELAAASTKPVPRKRGAGTEAAPNA